MVDLLTFLFLGIYGRLISYIPDPLRSFIGYLLAELALTTELGTRVERGVRRLAEVYPGAQCANIRVLVRQHVRFLVDVFNDMLYLRYHHNPLPRVLARVRMEGKECLDEALKGGRGAILCSLHMGNFLWSTTYLASIYRIHLVVRGESNPRWEAFANGMRLRFGIKTIYAEGGARKIRSALKNGEVVIFVIDQYILPFFHGPNHPFRGIISRIARIAGSPVISFVTLQQGKDIIIHFDPPLQDPLAEHLEGIIREQIGAYPHLWFWWRRVGKVKRGERTRRQR